MHFVENMYHISNRKAYTTNCIGVIGLAEDVHGKIIPKSLGKKRHSNEKLLINYLIRKKMQRNLNSSYLNAEINA